MQIKAVQFWIYITHALLLRQAIKEVLFINEELIKKVFFVSATKSYNRFLFHTKKSDRFFGGNINFLSDFYSFFCSRWVSVTKKRDRKTMMNINFMFVSFKRITQRRIHIELHTYFYQCQFFLLYLK